MQSARTLSIIVLAIAFAVGGSVASAQAVKPEDGYLSPERYLNRYFGLSLDIPAQLNLVPIPVPEVQGAKRWLLALQAGAKSHAVTVTITASAPPKKGKVAPALRADFGEDFPYTQPSKAARVEIGGQKFWKMSVPATPETDTANVTEYGGVVRDYLLTIRIATEAGPLPDGFQQMIESASFVPESQVPVQRTAEMFQYAGPALPELGPPTPAIARLQPGVTDGRTYRNDVLGIAYNIPNGLRAEPAQLDGAGLSARLAAWGGDGDPKMAQQIANTCTKPLLVADAGQRQNDGHVTPSVMITAIDPACLQGAHFPASSADKQAVQSLAESLGRQVRLGRPGSTMKGEIYRAGDRIFLSLTGVFYGTEPGTGLRIPNRLRMIATQLDAYVVVWTFVAPDRETVERLASNPVHFFPAPGAAATSSNAELK